MKLLLVSPFTSASGSAIRFWNIAQVLAEKGCSVVYADRCARHSRRLHAAAGVAYYHCPSSGVLFIDIIISLFFYSLVFLRHFDCAIFYALKPAPNNCLVALAARLLGKRIILDVDDLDYAYLKRGAAQRLIRFSFDHLPRMFDLVTYHTPRLRDYLTGAARVPEHKLYYLAQGVTPLFLAPSDPAVQLPFPPATLLYLATLGVTSDFDDLIPGLKKLFDRTSGITLDVVGDGVRRSEFQRMVRNAGIDGRVRFTGTIDHAALPAFIAAHHIGINYMRPSTVNRCRAVLKIREYLACGLEVVCNDVGDVELFKEYIHIEPSIDRMFETVSDLLSRPRIINNAGRNFIAEHFRWTAIIEAFCARIGIS